VVILVDDDHPKAALKHLSDRDADRPSNDRLNGRSEYGTRILSMTTERLTGTICDVERRNAFEASVSKVLATVVAKLGQLGGRRDEIENPVDLASLE